MFYHRRKSNVIQELITSKGNRIYHLGSPHRRPNRYYAEIKPFLCMLRLIGRFPYPIPANGPIRFQLFSFPTLYSMCFYTVQAYWTINALKMVYTAKKESSSYDDTLFSILITVFLLNNVVTPLTYWMQGLKMISYIESWQRCQDELKFVTIDLSKKLLTRFIVTGVLPGAVLIVCIGTYVLNNLPLVSVVPFIVSIIATELSLNFWCVTLGYIEIISKELLRNVIENECRDLKMLRKVWMRLCRQLTGLGHKMVHMIVFTALVFVTFLLSMYGVLAYLFRLSVTTSSLWGFIGGCSSCILVHYIFCHVAYQSSQELGRRFTSQFLMIDYSTQSKEYLNELMLLLQTMESNVPVIRFFGFITVSRRLFVSFITNAITYLIVLVQFEVCHLANLVRA